MLVASLRAGAGGFCLPFVATLPNTVLCPFTLAVDGTPPLTPSCPTPLYIHAVYVSAWRFGARGVRNTVELKLPSLATVGTGIFPALPPRSASSPPKSSSWPPVVNFRATRPSRGEGARAGGSGCLSWSAVLAFEAPLPLCLSRAPWTLQEDSSQYDVLEEHVRGEHGQGLGECWASLGSVTHDAHPSPPHLHLVAQRSCVLKLRCDLG